VSNADNISVETLRRLYKHAKYILTQIRDFDHMPNCGSIGFQVAEACDCRKDRPKDIARQALDSMGKAEITSLKPPPPVPPPLPANAGKGGSSKGA
jgi:hypothetical protein